MLGALSLFADDRQGETLSRTPILYYCRCCVVPEKQKKESFIWTEQILAHKGKTEQKYCTCINLS